MSEFGAWDHQRDETMERAKQKLVAEVQVRPRSNFGFDAMMEISQQEEQFSHAFVHAVASVAGFSIYRPDVDDDSVDLTIAGRGGRGIARPPRIEIQLKCTNRGRLTRQHLIYPVKRKNYDDLRLADLIVPRLLVVVTLPSDSEWLEQSERRLILRRCAYWASLRGLEERENVRSISIRLPRRNVFSVESLRGLMRRAGDKEPL
jgi:hypothetical protein